MINQVYTTELQLNNATSLYKIYDKQDDYDFDIVNIIFLDGDVPCPPSNGVCISHLI